MSSLEGKVKVGDIVVFNGLDNAVQFEVIDFVGPFDIKVREVNTDYEYEFTDVDLIQKVVKKGQSK